MAAQTATVSMNIRRIPNLVPEGSESWMPAVAKTVMWSVIGLLGLALAIFLIVRFTNPTLPPPPPQVPCADQTVASSQGECTARVDAKAKQAKIDRLEREKAEADARHAQERRDDEARRERERLQDELERERARRPLQPAVYTTAPPPVAATAPTSRSSSQHVFSQPRSSDWMAKHGWTLVRRVWDESVKKYRSDWECHGTDNADDTCTPHHS